MNTDNITSLVTLALSLSIAVERVIEILKGLIPPLATQQANLTREYLRCAILHFLTVAVGGLAAAGGHVDFFLKITGKVSDSPQSTITGYLICGLLAAGGSAFWNHILDIVKATKIKDESRAQESAKTAGNQNPIPA